MINSNENKAMSKNSSEFMTLVERAISPFLIESVREDFVTDLWEYHLELQHKGLSTLEINQTILMESISFVRLSTKIYFQDLEKRKRFNPSVESLLRRRFMGAYEDMIDIPEFITWGEYELFLHDQVSERFHSRAFLPKQFKTGNEPVKGISKSDAYWFCGWLSARASLQPESQHKLYDFRFNLSGDGLKVIRVEIPLLYKKLHKYLSFGAWYDADLEYSQLTLVLTRREEYGYLAKGDFLNIRHSDSDAMDNLWLNFSGGKFGLTPQKVIYQQCEDKLRGFRRVSDRENKLYEKKLYAALYKEIGWNDKAEEQFDFDTEIRWSLNSPIGHLPIKSPFVQIPKEKKIDYLSDVMRTK